MKYLVPIVLLVCLSARAQTDGPATLPTGFNTTSGVFDTTFPNTTGYTVKTVCASGCDYTSVATAYSTEGCKTVLRIRANQAFNGQVVFNKVCTSGNWIILMSDDCTSANVCTNLPAQGNRIAATPATAPVTHMAKITGANVAGQRTILVGQSAGGVAYNWIGPGIEITGPADGTTAVSSVIEDDQTVSGAVNTGYDAIHFIVFDRDYVHCAAAEDCTRMYDFGGHNIAVVDSIFSDAHALGGVQTQAVWAAEGYGPYKIVNNYLGASSEPFFSGGSGCTSTNVNQSDIELAGNYLVYDFGSRAATFLNSTNAGNIRSTIEIKDGNRILIQGNYQDGTAVAGKSANDLDYGIDLKLVNSCTWMATSNVTYRFNYVLHPSPAISIPGAQNAPGTANTFFNFSLHDDLFDDMNATNGLGQTERGIYISTQATEVTTNVKIDHITMVASDTPSAWGVYDSGVTFPLGSPQIITNSIGWEGLHGIGAFIDGVYNAGTAGLNQAFSNGAAGYTITGNVWVDSTGSAGVTWPAGNNEAVSATAVGFTNYNSGSGGNYLLTSGSAYHNAATDGKDIGVSDYTCLNSMTGAALAGTYTESVGACASGVTPAPPTPAAPTKLGILLMAGTY